MALILKPVRLRSNIRASKGITRGRTLGNRDLFISICNVVKAATIAKTTLQEASGEHGQLRDAVSFRTGSTILFTSSLSPPDVQVWARKRPLAILPSTKPA
jgi:hypothetical protein